MLDYKLIKEWNHHCYLCLGMWDDGEWWRIFFLNVVETLLLVSAWIRLIEQTSLKQIYLQLIRKSLGTAGLDKWFAHLNYPSITPYHHLCLMRVTGMLHTLPALSGKGRNTPRTHLQSIAGHTLLTHTHTEGTFSASDQLNLHVWLWEDTVLEEKVQKKREHTYILLAMKLWS